MSKTQQPRSSPGHRLGKEPTRIWWTRSWKLEGARQIAINHAGYNDRAESTPAGLSQAQEAGARTESRVTPPRSRGSWDLSSDPASSHRNQWGLDAREPARIPDGSKGLSAGSGCRFLITKQPAEDKAVTRREKGREAQPGQASAPLQPPVLLSVPWAHGGDVISV